MSHFYHHEGQLKTVPIAWLEGMGFRLGIRPFTTIRHDGVGAQLWSYHEQRLRRAMTHWGATQQRQDVLLKQCQAFVNTWKRANIIRIDLVLLNEAGQFDWFATVRELVTSNDDSVVELVSEHNRTPRGDGQVKYANYQKEEAIRLQLKTQKELLFEDQLMGLQEASTSNILLWNSKGVILPVTGEKGILQGVYLKAFCDYLHQTSIEIKTEKLFFKSIGEDSLLVLSNCVKGFRRARLDHQRWSATQERLWLELKECEREFLNFSTTGELSPV